MQRPIHYMPGVALFVAGIAAGVLTNARRERVRKTTATDPIQGQATARPASPESDNTLAAELQHAIGAMETRLRAQETRTSERFAQIESRLEEHAARLAEAPTTTQIVGAMEQLLQKTMASLDDRLTTQAHSIEVLKTTVSQTDSLLERVLESLDSLQTSPESELAEDVLFSRA